MSFWTKIFSTPDTVSKSVDAVIKGADALVFTEEEKAGHNAKMLEFYLEWLRTSTPQTLARRLIALMVVGLWTLLLVLTAVVWTFDAEYSAFLFGLVTDPSVAGPTGLIMAFYFGAHLARAMK